MKRCLETRTLKSGAVRRRYELDDGRRITTFEVPSQVLGTISKRQLAAALEAWHRGEATRARQLRIKQMLKAGVSMREIADEVGVTPARVSQVRLALGLSEPRGPYGPRKKTTNAGADLAAAWR